MGSGQVRHVQSSQVFRVRGTEDVFVFWFRQQGQHGSTNVGKVGDETVVHDGVPTEGERVVVDGRYPGAGGGADVGKQSRRRRVGADAVEVGVVGGGLRVLVHGGTHPFGRRDKVGAGVGVPSHAEAVDVEQSVAQSDLFTGGLFPGSVGEELRQVVVVDLFGEAVRRTDQDVFQETFLRR